MHRLILADPRSPTSAGYEVIRLAHLRASWTSRCHRICARRSSRRRMSKAYSRAAATSAARVSPSARSAMCRPRYGVTGGQTPAGKRPKHHRAFGEPAADARPPGRRVARRHTLATVLAQTLPAIVGVLAVGATRTCHVLRPIPASHESLAHMPSGRASSMPGSSLAGRNARPTGPMSLSSGAS